MTTQDKVLIFDTTLRDGEQSPGVALNVEEKLEIARSLERMQVDFIEAGFPASSPGDLESVTQIARQVRGSAIAGLARAVPGDVDACWEAVQHAEHPRIHVFLSSSDIHIMHQLERDKERVLEMARTMVARAKKHCDDVEPHSCPRLAVEVTVATSPPNQRKTSTSWIECSSSVPEPDSHRSFRHSLA